MLSRFLLVLVVVALFFAAPGRASAGDDEVQVTLIAVLANEKSSDVDKRLRCIADEVRKQHPELTAFKLATQNEKPIAIGGKERGPLGGSVKGPATIVDG